MRNLSITIFAIFIVFYACKKDAGVAIDIGYEYFPVNTGKWVIYDVDSTVYNDFDMSVKTYSYQVKEVIESVFLDNEGRESLRIERYKRDADSLAWQTSDVWSANRTSATAERVEENIRYIKLVFAVKKGKSWNGNSQNNKGEMQYEYTSTDVAYSIGGFSFDSAATILQTDQENLIEKKYQQEVYAKNVGMVYKEIIDVRDNNSTIDTSIPLMQRVNTGVIYIMKLKAYGN